MILLMHYAFLLIHYMITNRFALKSAILLGALLVTAASYAAKPTIVLTPPAASSPAADSASSAIPIKEQARLIALLLEKIKVTATKVEASPLPGFFEMTVGSSVLYMDSAGKWLFDGHLVDMDTRTSVTAIKKAELSAKNTPALDWRSLKLNDAVKTTYGQVDASRVIVTFEDPNCGYCRRLHPELAKVPNITIYTFQVSILGPASQAKNEDIWCAKDRSAAWALTMQGQAVKADSACDTSAITRNGDLARRLGVSGTPTIFFADGTRQPGAMDSLAIEAKLKALASAVKP